MESEVEKITGELYDVVHRPSHYCSGGIEPKDFIRANDLNFNRGNAIKYVTRAGKKDPEKEIEDLEKAKQYLQFEIDYLTYIKNGGSIC